MSNLASTARARLPRLAEAATSRARLVLVPARATSARRTPFVALVLALLAVGMVGLLLFNTLMQQDSFKATALQQRADSLQARQQTLSFEVSQLRDPQRLAERARALGMVNPPTPAFLRLSDGKVLGVARPATVADAVHVRKFPAAKPADMTRPPLVVRVPAGSERSGRSESTGRGQRAGGAEGGTDGTQQPARSGHGRAAGTDARPGTTSTSR